RTGGRDAARAEVGKAAGGVSWRSGDRRDPGGRTDRQPFPSGAGLSRADRRDGAQSGDPARRRLGADRRRCADHAEGLTMFELSEEHRMLQDLVAKFIDRDVMPLEKAVLAREMSGQKSSLSADEEEILLGKCRELGLWGLDV